MKEHRRADADRVAADSRDQRLLDDGQQPDESHHVLAEIAGALRRREKIGDVVAGGENSVRSRYDVGGDRTIRVGRFERVAEALDTLRRSARSSSPAARCEEPERRRRAILRFPMSCEHRSMGVNEHGVGAVLHGFREAFHFRQQIFRKEPRNRDARRSFGSSVSAPFARYAPPAVRLMSRRNGVADARAFSGLPGTFAPSTASPTAGCSRLPSDARRHGRNRCASQRARWR